MTIDGRWSRACQWHEARWSQHQSRRPQVSNDPPRWSGALYL